MISCVCGNVEPAEHLQSLVTWSWGMFQKNISHYGKLFHPPTPHSQDRKHRENSWKFTWAGPIVQFTNIVGFQIAFTFSRNFYSEFFNSFVKYLWSWGPNSLVTSCTRVFFMTIWMNYSREWTIPLCWRLAVVALLCEEVEAFDIDAELTYKASSFM